MMGDEDYGPNPALYGRSSEPIGIRQNNPGNIRDWPGAGKEGGFAKFDTPEDGLSAMVTNLASYQDKHGINTISGIVNRWAPKSDKNDVGAYIADLTKKTGFKADQPLSLKDQKVLSKLIPAMIEHENAGKNPFTKSIEKVLGSLGPKSAMAGDEDYGPNPADYGPNPANYGKPPAGKPGTKTTGTDILKEETAKMSGPEKALIGVGGGMVNFAHGVKQLGAEAGNKLGLVKPETLAKVNEEGLQDRNLMNTLKSGEPWYGPAHVGEVIGQTAPLVTMPGGVTGGALKRIGTAALAGGAVGGSQFVAPGESRTENALMGAAGGAVLPGANKLIGGAATLGKQTLGRLTGAGSGAIEGAFESGMQASPFRTATNFSKAMRGETNPNQVVEVANEALNKIKGDRAAAYREKLAEIKGNNSPIDIAPIKQEMGDLMKRYNINIDRATGKVDFSRVAMGKKGVKDIKEILKTLSGWGGQPGDNTAVGLDTLKRQLDDFYSDSSQARQFVTALRNKTRQTIEHAVPEYKELTKGYAEATRVIKDIESGLMMRKQGMSGRVTADQTLRRLTSAMKDNFELRNSLVKELTAQGEQDVTGAIAGHAMKPLLPHGLAGTGPIMIGEAALAHYVDPRFWPMLAMSSPRVAGEFVQGLGYGAKISKAIVQSIPKKAREGIGKAARTVAAEEAARSTGDKWESIGTDE